MGPLERRGLTPAEIALGRLVFSDEIAWPRVRVLQVAGAPWQAMVPVGGTIVFGVWRAARDFAAAAVGEQGWFIHELAHVWQARRGVTLAAAKLNALGAGAYRLRVTRDKPFAAYNIEQQAEIARAVFLHRVGSSQLAPAPQAAVERLWPVIPAAHPTA
jgi:hypothetical protein